MLHEDASVMARYGIRFEAGLLRVRKPLRRDGGVFLGFTILALTLAFCVAPRWLGSNHPAFPIIGLSLACLHTAVVTLNAWIWVEFAQEARAIRRHMFGFGYILCEFSNVESIEWLPLAPADDQPEALHLILRWVFPSGRDLRETIRLTAFYDADDPEREKVDALLRAAFADLGVLEREEPDSPGGIDASGDEAAERNGA